MIFESLYAASKRGELLLIDGGFCHWHLRRDGQLTILEIISIRKGAGTEMLSILEKRNNAKNILAKCPEDLESNSWYERRGFSKIRTETTKTGRRLNVWSKDLPYSLPDTHQQRLPI